MTAKQLSHAEAQRPQRGIAATKWPQKTRKTTKGFVSTTKDTKYTKKVLAIADLGVLRGLCGYQEFAHAARILNVCSAEVADTNFR